MLDPINTVNSHKGLGVTFRFYIYIRLTVNKAPALSSNFLKTTLCRSEVFTKSFSISPIWLLLEFAPPVWNTGYLGKLFLLESVQRRWTKMTDGLAKVLYSHCLFILNLYLVKGRLLSADLLKWWKIFCGKSSFQPSNIFAIVSLPETRGHRFKNRHSLCSTEGRGRFFSHAYVSVCNSLLDDWLP